MAAHGIVGSITAIHGVPDQHLLLLLTITIHTSVALFHHVGVVGDLQVNEPITVVLQVDTLGSSIGGQQDAHAGFVGTGLEGSLDHFAFVLIHPAMDDRQALTPVAMRSQDLFQPLVSGAIFGEQYDAIPVPFPIILQIFLDPVDDGHRLGIGTVALPLSPLA